MKKIVIAIDGPAGSGKSTVAKILSSIYGVYYLDTGAMYRAVAYKVIEESVDISDSNALKLFLENLDMHIEFDNMQQRTIVAKEDVTPYIRSEEVTLKSSDVAVVPMIRLKLVEIQREFAMKNGGIIDGRDIGTYVFPDANFKFYLTATLEERAKRRYNEYIANGHKVDFGQTIDKIRKRDAQDSGREFAPLMKAGDAIEIDSTHKTSDEVVNTIMQIITTRS